MVTVALTSSGPANALRYKEVMERLGTEIRLLFPEDAGTRPTDVLMEGVGGLLLPGGPDVDPVLYDESPDPSAGLEVCRPLDDLDLRLLNHALEKDMPVLAICRGMQILNVAFGGKLIQDLPGHRAMEEEDGWVSATHQIYVSPGCKTSAILGMAGFFRVNSRHHQGLREAQRALPLMASAYGVDDGLVEGLESPEHTWVIGVQCHPERQDEVPKLFANLFEAFGERAAAYAEACYA